MISFPSQSNNVKVASGDDSAPFCTLHCRNSGLLRFLRDEEGTLYLNVVDLLEALGCEGNCVPEGAGGKNLFDLKPNAEMTLDAGFGTYLTPSEVKSVIANCESSLRGTVLTTLKTTWPCLFA